MSGYCGGKECSQKFTYSSSKFCRECGNELMPLTCKYCNRELLRSDRFCSFCGRPVDDAA